MEDLQELISNTAGFPEEEVCVRLSERLRQLFEADGEAFFALMYRLDIREDDVRRALESRAVMAIIAQLVYQRQLQKACLRKQHSSGSPLTDDDPDLKW